MTSKSPFSDVKLKLKNMRIGFVCDQCESSDIIETREGYVCRACGIVLDIHKLAYNRPYNNDLIQHAKIGLTQIGFQRERMKNARSIHLKKMNMLHLETSYEETIKYKAKIEISRLFDVLELPKSMKDIVFQKFSEFRKSLRPGTKYRNPEKLIPITLYFVFKLRNLSIKEAALLEVSKISKQEFNAFKLQILQFMPQYKSRDRKIYIIQKILKISEDFNLGMKFFYISKKILYALWDNIKNTKDDVIAGLVVSIVILCTCKEKVTVSSVCHSLGIKMSTIQSQVKKKIFDQFQVEGFTTLLSSSELLKKIMIKMKLLTPENINLYEKAKIKRSDKETDLPFVTKQLEIKRD